MSFHCCKFQFFFEYAPLLKNARKVQVPFEEPIEVSGVDFFTSFASMSYSYKEETKMNKLSKIIISKCSKIFFSA